MFCFSWAQTTYLTLKSRCTLRTGLRKLKKYKVWINVLIPTLNNNNCHGIAKCVPVKQGDGLCFSTRILIILATMLIMLFYNIDIVIIYYHSRVHLKSWVRTQIIALYRLMESFMKPILIQILSRRLYWILRHVSSNKIPPKIVLHEVIREYNVALHM